MEYEFALVVPAATPLASPFTDDLQLEQGIIHYLEVRFEAGCQREVHCKLERWGHQAFPKLPSVSFSSEDETIKKDTRFPLLAEPYSLKFYGWSPSADYNHTITVRIDILPADELAPTNVLLRALNKFFSLIPGFR